jgi:hypothetical protein
VARRRLLPADAFAPWFDRFLPRLAERRPETLFRPATVTAARLAPGRAVGILAVPAQGGGTQEVGQRRVPGPVLIEAECLRRLLPADAFAPWFDRFLPRLAERRPETPPQAGQSASSPYQRRAVARRRSVSAVSPVPSA